MQKGLTQAQKDGYLELEYWKNHTIQQIRERFAAQNVWPRGFPGPYSHYREINEKRRKNGKWYSKGRVYTDQELYAHVYNAANGNTTKITFFYNHILDFVCWGVGRGRKMSDAVERHKDNKNPMTLFARWGMPRDAMTAAQRRAADVAGYTARKSRPGVMQEIRHQTRRVEEIAAKYWGRFVAVNIIEEDIDLKDSTGKAIKYRSINNHRGPGNPSGTWIEVSDVTES